MALREQKLQRAYRNANRLHAIEHAGQRLNAMQCRRWWYWIRYALQDRRTKRLQKYGPSKRHS